MAQLSRPYQIAIGALVLAVLMWFLAFGRHSSSTPSSSSAPPSTAHANAGTPSSPAGGTVTGSSHIYHGAAPGVEGLTRDIAKAHGAAATSEAYEKRLEEKSAQAASEAPASRAGRAAATPAATASAGAVSASSTHARAHTPAHRHSAPARASHPSNSHAAVKSGAPSGQRAVEATLARGQLALLLFLNPKGTDDVAVRGQVRSLPGSLRVHVYESPVSGVASFGSITREVPVYGTPTILIVAKHGRAMTLTGLQDAYSIEQAIAEARRAAS